MRANGHNDKSHFGLGWLGRFTQAPHLASSHGPDIPCPPVAPEALLLFELLLSSPIVDLRAITEVIRADIGLTVQVLKLAGEERNGLTQSIVDIEDLVVLLGINRLKSVFEEATVLSVHPRGEAGVTTYERFCMHARLTALIAEELALETATVRPEDAYLAGLLRHVGAIPFVLGWTIPELEHSESGEIGGCIAQNWRLPQVLVDVIRGNREACATVSLALFDIVQTADKHAFRLAVGCDY